MASPLVAIVGRPNVGKSTLFNTIAGTRDAIVSDVPGTTRDRLLAEVEWGGSRFTLVDTGGLEPRPEDPLRDKVQAQAEVAVAEADLIIFLLDVADGLTHIDEEVANWLRRGTKPLVVAVNKVDNVKRENSAAEFYALGLEDPILISAYHKRGIHDLMETVVSHLPTQDVENGVAEEPEMRLAIIGRTNVGKSMLLNAILGEERAIVSDVPGTTRDALDTRLTYNDEPITVIDTAGLRRPGKVERGIEYYSVLRATRAIQRCDIALLVMDATELAAAQDAHIVGEAWDAYKGLIVVVNKWDLARKEEGFERELAIQEVRARLHFAPYVPIVFTSALLGEGIQDLMMLATDVYKERQQHVPPGRLKYALMDALSEHAPPSKGGKRLRIDDVRQVDVNPPTIVMAVNDPDRVHFSYKRYLENRFRTTFGFTHTHLRLVFRKRI